MELDPSFAFLTPHAFACTRYECRRPIRWCSYDLRGVWIGWCHEHRPRDARLFSAPITPIAIHAFWCDYPMGVRLYAQLADMGAFDERGRTRPAHLWHPDPYGGR